MDTGENYTFFMVLTLSAIRALMGEDQAEAAFNPANGGVKLTEARRHVARPPSRERRSMPRGRATRPRQQSVSACRLAS